jgi:RNA polymerase sigma factor (sigma-70 family)
MKQQSAHAARTSRTATEASSNDASVAALSPAASVREQALRFAYSECRRCGLSPQHAEDIAQEACLVVLQRADAGTLAVRHREAWLRGVVRHLALAARRRARDRVRAERHRAEFETWRRLEPARRVLGRAELDVLLEDVDGRHRSVVEPRLAGHSLAEIASSLRMAKTAVVKRLTSAITAPHLEADGLLRCTPRH